MTKRLPIAQMLKTPLFIPAGAAYLFFLGVSIIDGRHSPGEPYYFGSIGLLLSGVLVSLALTNKKWYYGPRYIAVIVLAFTIYYISAILVGLLTGNSGR